MARTRRTPPEALPPWVDTLTIEFEDRPEKVVTRQAPVSFTEYYAVVDAHRAALWSDRESIVKAFETFAPFLISWDFPAPATATGLESLDIVLAMTVIGTWILEVRNVPPPLARRSSAGAPSEG